MTDPANIEYWNQQTDLAAAVWSEPDWDQGVEDCLTHICKWMPPIGQVLDVGAGIGRLAIPVAKRMQLEVWAYEPSDTMRNGIPDSFGVHPTGVWPDTTFTGAWCVLVMQHLEYVQQADLILQTAARLEEGARFVMQTVHGYTDSPGSHHVMYPRLARWLDDAGLRPLEVRVGGVFDHWLWVGPQTCCVFP